MKNFNILGVHWKIPLLGEGVYEKPILRRGLPKKEGAWQDRREWCFWGGGRGGGGGEVDTTMHSMNRFLWHSKKLEF